MPDLALIKPVFSRRRPLGLLIAVLILAFSFHARADDDDEMISTNVDRRPIEDLFKTDTVYPQEKGELEVEVISMYQNHSGEDRWTLPVSLEYGLTDKWQVEAEWDSLVQRYPRNQSVVGGIGDVEVGTQYSFMNVGDSLFHIAPRFSLQIPVGDVNKGLSEGFLEYEPALIFARDFPELHKTQLFTEVGLSFVQRLKRPADTDDADPAAQEFNLGAGFFTLIPHGALSMEFNWNNNRWNHHGTDDELYWTPGWLWRALPHMEVGIGLPVGLNNTSDRFQLIAHVVWEF